MIWHWRYYQAYFLTLILPYLDSYPTGNVYQLDSALSGYLIRQSRDLSWKPFSTITPFNFSAQPQVSMDKINRNPGFSSSTSTSNAERIDTKNPKLELASALGVAIDINGPLGEVGSSFQGSQNTGKGATSQAGALTGNKGKKGPANAQTAAQANIVVDDPNAEATAGVRNSANVIMSGNAKGNAQSAGSVNTKAPDGTITTLAPPAAAAPLKVVAVETAKKPINSQPFAPALASAPPKKAAAAETAGKPNTIQPSVHITSTTTTTTTTTRKPTTTTTPSTTTTASTTTPAAPAPTEPAVVTDTVQSSSDQAVGTDEGSPPTTADSVTDAATTVSSTPEEPTEIGGESDESEEERPHRRPHRRPPPQQRPQMHGGFRREEQYERQRFGPQRPNGYFVPNRPVYGPTQFFYAPG